MISLLAEGCYQIIGKENRKIQVYDDWFRPIAARFQLNYNNEIDEEEELAKAIALSLDNK